MKAKRDLSTMAQYLIWAMENRRPVTNQEIYRAVEGACARHGRELPNQWEAAVRQTLQAHCSSSPQYNGRDDFFVHHERGLWSCKVELSTLVTSPKPCQKDAR
jgi:hypothetical protein